MLQIPAFTEAKLATLTPRSEKHGDDEKPAVSLGLEITTTNDVLDAIDLALRPALYKAPDSKSLPGVADVLNVLRCNSIDRVLLPTKHEGWTLSVDDGIDETKPLDFGGCKVDKVSVEPMQGGSIVLRMRVGTSDLDAARSGMLGMHVGQSIWITLIAPKAGQEQKDEKPAKGKKPDATDLFLEHQAGDKQKPAVLSSEPAWPFPKGDKPAAGKPPQHLVEEKAPAKKAAAKKLPYKYRNPATGDTWSGRGLQPKWLKVALAGGGKLGDFEVSPTSTGGRRGQ